MKKCKKCGAILSDDDKDKICEECREKKKKIVKAVVPIMAAAATTAVYSLLRGKATKQISDATIKVASSIVENSDKMFGGLSQSMLDDLAKNTSRGVKAVIQDEGLRYFYKSASGKTTNSALFKFNDGGKLIGYLGNGPYYAANSPRFFYDKVFEALQRIKEV